jgi:pyruvate kinase
MPAPQRTKIVATIGPASRSPDALAGLVEAGVDVCRLNFSHGTQDEHADVLRTIRRAAADAGRSVGVLADLCGPKIRLSTIRGGAALELTAGDEIVFPRGEGECGPGRLHVSYARFVDEVQPGHRIYIDDGLVRLLAVERTNDAVHAVCKVGGSVTSRKGVNLPDTKLSVPALTQKDRSDLAFAVRVGVDYVALSFVRRGDDVAELRDLLRQADSDIHIISKIEKGEALRNLDSILELSDGAMVARGDLGVEMDVWRVPLAQKMITRKCRALGKPVIVATQMLQSMVSSPMPTRAEVSDVANAILDGADAIMLSAETASGQYPAAAVDMMHRVALAVEEFQALHDVPLAPPPRNGGQVVLAALATGAVEAVRHLGAKLVAVWTRSGASVSEVARHRLTVPVVGLTHDERAYHRMALVHGVIPLLIEPLESSSLLTGIVEARLKARGLVQPGDPIVLVTSTAPMQRGATDTLSVHRVGSDARA